MITSIHKSQDGRVIVAVCDNDLHGKRFEEASRQLDLSAQFYQGTDMEPDAVGDLLRNADAVNLVGKKSVAMGISEGVIDEEKVTVICGIPVAQAIILHD
ncbi:DUF424 family protein [Candidatus Woesearchaeota archaeon]|nr:DUF424 family protein [Candidatus Woesearchaeota archaeon]